MSEEHKVIAEQREVMGEQRDVMGAQHDGINEKKAATEVLAQVAVKTRNVNKGLAVALILMSALCFTLGFVAYRAVNIASGVEYERHVNRYLLCKLLWIQGVKKDPICLSSGFDFEGKPIW